MNSACRRQARFVRCGRRCDELASPDTHRRSVLSALLRSVGFAPEAGARHIDPMGLPKKVRRRAPRRWAEPPSDLLDYLDAGPLRRSSVAKTVVEGSVIVTDDWPDTIPIGDAELRAIEAHMRRELDKLFGPLP